MDILKFSKIITLMSTQTWRDVYFEMLYQMKNSDGACQRAFNNRMRSIGMAEFAEDISHRLRW